MKAIRRDKKGQFLVASALLIAILFISVASFLTSTATTNIKLLRDDFRKDAIQIVSNFRGALTLAIADVSGELELRSSLFNYEKYVSLEEYPEAETYGNKTMASWYNITLLQYAGRSLNLSVTNQVFECEWNASEFYSRTSANMALDILSYGFCGLKQNMTSELRLQILDGKKEGEEVAFTIRLLKEEGLPVTDLKSSFVKVLYQKIDCSFKNVSDVDVAYLGNGFYNVTFSASNSTTPVIIKMILRDGRGIAVAAIPTAGVTISDKDDDVGPITNNVLCSPNPCQSESQTRLTATIDDTTTGANFVMAAEYFIDIIGENGTGMSMSASDSYFDSPHEDVAAQVSVAALSVGMHTVYVHGMDAFGNWGNYNSTILEVTDDLQTMHISDINVRATRSWWWFYIHGEATVTVVDSSGGPVRGATVSGHWSGSVHRYSSGTTGTDGRVPFNSEDVFYWGWGFGGRLEFTFTVDNIVKAGWTYDESANVETSDTDYYP
jgi:hypothetical protein